MKPGGSSFFLLLLLLLASAACEGALPVVIPNEPAATEAPSTGPAPLEPAVTVPAEAPTAAPPLPTMPGAASAIVTSTPFLARPAPRQAVAVPILMYHHLQTLGPNPSQLQRDWTVAPDRFIAQLDYLLAQGYHTITFAQLLDFFEKGRSLPLHPIILTFDDGWLDDYTVAFPALRERGMVGTFFIPTVYADAGGKTLVNWAQVIEMDAAGMELGGHTLNHANLKQAPAEEVARQLRLSKQKMESKLGHATLAFSYPFGAFDAQVEAQVGSAGYRAAVGLCCGYQLRADILLALPRIRISYDDALPDLIKKLPPAAGK